MQDVLDRPLSEFLRARLPERPAEILELEAAASVSGFPIIGPVVGRLLETVARAVAARRVLELGSGFGYSAYWLGRALPPAGAIVCTDHAADNAARARALHARTFAHVALEFLVGDALAAAEGAAGPFDLVFVDIDKADYPRGLELARRKVRPGGAIVFDNVLWSRRVLPGGDHLEPSTAGVLELHRALDRAPDLVTSILPIRDGVSVSIKLA